MRTRSKTEHVRSITKIVYKGALSSTGDRFVIIALGITNHCTVRGNAIGKCRASKAYTIAICPLLYPSDHISIGKDKKSHARSWYEYDYTYEVGKWQVPEFQFNRGKKGCSSGIHFFQGVSDAAHYLRSRFTNVAYKVKGAKQFETLPKDELERLKTLDNARID